MAADLGKDIAAQFATDEAAAAALTTRVTSAEAAATALAAQVANDAAVVTALTTRVSTLEQQVASLVTPAPPAPLWVADMETGDFTQFDGGLQQFAVGRATVVTSASALGGPAAARSGSKFAQFLVKSGDNASGGERCEALKGNLGIANGVDQWYGWSMALPANWPNSLNGAARSNLLGDFHSGSNAQYQGQANIQFLNCPNLGGANLGYTVASPGLALGINGGNPGSAQSGQYVNINSLTAGLAGDPVTSYALNLGPLAAYLGTGWVDLVLHIIWSDHGTGTVEVYRRFASESAFTKVAALTACSNLYKTYSAYLKIGSDRNPQTSGQPDGLQWFDDVKLLAGKPAGLP